jgi:hypothetical protein
MVHELHHLFNPLILQKVHGLNVAQTQYRAYGNFSALLVEEALWVRGPSMQ